MTALEEAGVNIPEDVSIVGIDDISFAGLARPPLTTIRVPRENLGATAFQALQRMLKLKRRRGSEYLLETELVIRKSTAPARKWKLRLENGKLKSPSSARKPKSWPGDRCRA
jgi:LacI family transcriptional regulator